MHSQMPEPNGNLIYLAGPIDAVTQDQATSWRTHAKQVLTFAGFWSFDPNAAFRVGRVQQSDIHAYGARIDAINRLAITTSAAVLAKVELGQETVGTWREIEFARSLGMPVFLVGKGYQHHMLLHDIRVFDTTEEAVGALREMFELKASRFDSASIDIPGIGKIHMRPITREQLRQMEFGPFEESNAEQLRKAMERGKN